MRRLTLAQIAAKVAYRSGIDAFVSLFRGKTKQEGWIMKRTRPGCCPLPNIQQAKHELSQLKAHPKFEKMLRGPN